jgi:hypothetical protein
MARTEWILRFIMMVPFITYVSMTAVPKQLSSKSSGGRTELLQKLATCSTGSVAS